MRFGDLMNENVNMIDKAKFELFLMIAGNVSPKRQEQYLTAVDTLNAAVTSGVIYNARYTEAVDLFKTACENIYKEIEKPVFKEIVKTGSWDYSFSWVSMKKYVAFWSKYQKQFPTLYKFAIFAENSKNVITLLKSKVVKGKEPKPADPNKFVKRPAKYDIRKQTSDFLNTVISNVRGDLMRANEQIYLGYLKDFQDNPLENLSGLLKIANGRKYLFAQKVHQSKIGKFVLRADAGLEVTKQAERDTDDIISQFLRKNTEKLALIFEKKGGLGSPKVSGTGTRNGILESTLRFDFEDGSGFTVYSQVEYATSAQGKPFLRIPTRFTNVRLSNGQMMKQPSEEKMIKDFS